MSDNRYSVYSPSEVRLGLLFARRSKLLSIFQVKYVVADCPRFASIAPRTAQFEVVHQRPSRVDADIDLSLLEYDEVNLPPGQWVPNATEALSDLTDGDLPLPPSRPFLRLPSSSHQLIARFDRPEPPLRRI